MKTKIHPSLQEITIHCSCGKNFVALSTKNEIRVEVCSQCHPLYTGEQRFLNVKGRVENFQKKQKVAADMKQVVTARKAKKDERSGRNTKSLRELLSEVK